MQSASISQVARSSYEMGSSLKNTSVSSAPSRSASARAASASRRSGPSPPCADMNTSRTPGQRSAAFTVAATAVQGSSQFQMPPFHSTTWAASPISG